MAGFAIHLGIDDYCDAAPCNPDDLKSAAFDAEEGFARLSRDRAFEILGTRALVNGEVDRQTIIDGIGKARHKLRSGDFLILTFDGYGGQSNGINTWELFEESIGIKVVLRLVRSLPDGVRALIVSSCCFSGALGVHGVRPFVRGLPVNANRLRARKARKRWTSTAWNDVATFEQRFRLPENNPFIALFSGCGANETVPDGASNQHSPFVREFVKLARETPRSLTDFGTELQSRLLKQGEVFHPFITRFPDPNSFDAGFESAGVFPQL